MKKTFLLVLFASLLIAGCNNEPPKTEEGTTTTIDTPNVQRGDSTEDSTDNGTSSMPAQVFEESTAKNIQGATVVVKEGDRVVETVTTNANAAPNSNYTLSRVASGHTYSYTASKSGFTSQTKTGVYENASSLPWFAMKP